MDKGLIRRLCFWAIGATTAIFALAFSSVYVYMRHELTAQADYDARRNLDMASNMIWDRLEIARTAVINSALPQKSGDSRKIVENLLHHNDDIYGSAIALKPEYARKYAGKDRFMIYSYRTLADTLSTFILSDSVSSYFQYPERDWFTYPVEMGTEHWSQPYLDQLTTGELMVSYSAPIVTQDSVIVGVFLADLTLGQGISHIVNEIDSASDYRTYMISGDRQIIFGDTTRLSNAVIYNMEIPHIGWTLGHIIDKDTLFGPLYKAMLNLTALFILTIMILCIAIYYTISLMTRPAVKRQMRIKAELDIASRIQEGMLPKMVPPFPNRKDLNIATVMKPAKEVGGDFYNYFLEDERLYFIIGDVSGKGVPAALIMAIATELFMFSAPDKQDPADIVDSINNILCRDNRENMFITMVVGILDVKTGNLSLCNAGHNLPICISAGKVCVLPLETNIPTGVIPSYAYISQTFDFPKGSTMILYTDGVTEAENPEREQFGESRLMQVIKENKDGTAHQLCDAVSGAVHTFTAGHEQSDDITMIILSRE